jgi:hypothetical protein
MINIQPKDTSKGHFYVSMVKSLVRIAAGSALISASMPATSTLYLIAAGALLIFAEMLGIVEELV